MFFRQRLRFLLIRPHEFYLELGKVLLISSKHKEFYSSNHSQLILYYSELSTSNPWSKSLNRLTLFHSENLTKNTSNSTNDKKFFRIKSCMRFAIAVECFACIFALLATQKKTRLTKYDQLSVGIFLHAISAAMLLKYFYSPIRNIFRTLDWVTEFLLLKHSRKLLLKNVQEGTRQSWKMLEIPDKWQSRIGFLI